MSGPQSNTYSGPQFNSQQPQAGRDVNNAFGYQENRSDTASQIVNNPVKQNLKADVDQSVKNMASNNKNQVVVGDSNKINNEQMGDNNINKINEQKGDNNSNSM